ncbi:MAG: hypothetical protein LQ350_000962 [Teloschistes chrysophthalmus]|nr:MAG: hypothetical protein LQ350_000962 [Niorma chrysophthalma]
MEEEHRVHQQVLERTVAKVKATTISASDNEAVDTCVICLDSVSERAAASPCRHDSFDFLCLVSWLQERKTEVAAVEYGWNSAHGCKTYNVPRRDNSGEHSSSTGNGQSPSIGFHGRPLWATSRPRRFARPKPAPEPDAALRRRREVYAEGLYSLHVGTNRLSRFRDLNTDQFNRDEELVRRARKWIRRELQVFEFLSVDGGTEGGVSRRANNAEFLLEYIVAILKTVDIKGSGGQAEDMLQEFLGRQNTQLFLHELKAWLRSPYISLEDWDRHVQYADAAPTAPIMAKSEFDTASSNHGAERAGRNNTSNTHITPTSNLRNRRDRRHNPYSRHMAAQSQRTYRYQPDGG